MSESLAGNVYLVKEHVGAERIGWVSSLGFYVSRSTNGIRRSTFESLLPMVGRSSESQGELHCFGRV